MYVFDTSRDLHTHALTQYSIPHMNFIEGIAQFQKSMDFLKWLKVMIYNSQRLDLEDLTYLQVL